MSRRYGKPGLRVIEVLAAWKSILSGHTPMLSIEVARECPLQCLGCYAYGENHLGGATALLNLNDYRGDEFVQRLLLLVYQHRPLHLSLVGGEPLLRHRELSRPAHIERNASPHLVASSAVIPIPREWMQIPRVRVVVVVDGLPEHHDIRRKPASYARILRNIAHCHVNIHWTITQPMSVREAYLEEFLAFWNARPKFVRIWASLYTPQKNERTPEMLSSLGRSTVARELARLQPKYPELLMNPGIARAIEAPPAAPSACMFARLSTNYSANLHTGVEPCIFGGDPDCTQCGCAISNGLHWRKQVRVARLAKIESLVKSSIAVGTVLGRLQHGYNAHPRAERQATAARDESQWAFCLKWGFEESMRYGKARSFFGPVRRAWLAASSFCTVDRCRSAP